MRGPRSSMGGSDVKSDAGSEIVGLLCGRSVRLPRPTGDGISPASTRTLTSPERCHRMVATHTCRFHSPVVSRWAKGRTIASKPHPRSAETTASKTKPVAKLPLPSTASSIDAIVSMARRDGSACCASAGPAASRHISVKADLDTATEQLLKLRLEQGRGGWHGSADGVDAGRVELRSGAALQLLERERRAARRTIGAGAGHRVERVGDVDDPRGDGDVVGAQAERVPL